MSDQDRPDGVPSDASDPPGGTPDAAGTEPAPPLEDPDEPDTTQKDAPDAPGVEHGSEENPSAQESSPTPEGSH